MSKLFDAAVILGATVLGVALYYVAWRDPVLLAFAAVLLAGAAIGSSLLHTDRMKGRETAALRRAVWLAQAWYAVVFVLIALGVLFTVAMTLGIATALSADDSPLQIPKSDRSLIVGTLAGAVTAFATAAPSLDKVSELMEEVKMAL